MGKLKNALLWAVVLATGVYFGRYLYGWEWNRAFVVGIVFVAAEVAIVGTRLGAVSRAISAATDRFNSADRGAAGAERVRVRVRGRDRDRVNSADRAERSAQAALADFPGPIDDRSDVAARVLAETPVEHPSPFRWLTGASEGRLPVFIPLLLGAGVLMSGVAWVMERLAGWMYGSRIDAALVKDVAALIPPVDLLDTPTVDGLLTRPGAWEDAGMERSVEHRGAARRRA